MNTAKYGDITGAVVGSVVEQKQLLETYDEKLRTVLTAKDLHCLDVASFYECENVFQCESKMATTDSKSHANALSSCLSSIVHMVLIGMSDLRDTNADVRGTLMDATENGAVCFCVNVTDAKSLYNFAETHYKEAPAWNEENVVRTIVALYKGLSPTKQQEVLQQCQSGCRPDNVSQSDSKTNDDSEPTVGAGSNIMDWLI